MSLSKSAQLTVTIVGFALLAANCHTTTLTPPVRDSGADAPVRNAVYAARSVSGAFHPPFGIVIPGSKSRPFAFSRTLPLESRVTMRRTLDAECAAPVVSSLTSLNMPSSSREYSRKRRFARYRILPGGRLAAGDVVGVEDSRSRVREREVRQRALDVPARIAHLQTSRQDGGDARSGNHAELPAQRHRARQRKARTHVIDVGHGRSQGLAHQRLGAPRVGQRLRGEVLLDAMTDVTGVAESFSAAPPRTRAVELWTVRTQSVFLDSFGRPDPNQDPPCERTSDTSVVQALASSHSAFVTHSLQPPSAGRHSKPAEQRLSSGLCLQLPPSQLSTVQSRLSLQSPAPQHSRPPALQHFCVFAQPVDSHVPAKRLGVAHGSSFGQSHGSSH